LAALIVERSRTYYANDRNYPAAWEPGGEEFFSPALIEADLMRRVMSKAEFAVWFRRFLPGTTRGRAEGAPATGNRHRSHRSQTGPPRCLNLSRAWCMRSIASALRKPIGRASSDPLALAQRESHAAACGRAAIMKASTGWLRLPFIC